MEFPPAPGRTASIAEWAAWCADVGRLSGAFKVFQCWPGEKLPLRKGWQQSATWDRKSVEAEWQNNPKANIGLAIQPGYIAIDADLYKPGKEDALDAYEAKHGELPPTLEFRSARGGVHLIYKTARDLGNSTGTLPDFGDVRGHGGLIVGPGSYFEGLRYAVDRAQAPVPLPAHVDAALVERRHRAPEETRELPQFVALDDPQNIARFIAWLKKDARVSVEGQGGNNALAATGAMGSSFALSIETTLDCLREHWNPRCQPPWEDEDLERHGGSGYRSASSQFGNMASKSPALMFSPAMPDAGWGPPLLTAASIAGKTPPDRRWAWGTDADGWMPEGDVTLLYGPGGAGKTALVGQLAIAFARGQALWDIPVKRMPVLFIACEDESDELWRRFAKQGIESADQIKFASFVGEDAALHPPFRRGEPLRSEEMTPFWLYLDFHLGQMGAGPKLLILDNLGQLYEGDYMDTGQIKAFLNFYVRGLIQKHNATTLLLAHPSDNQRANGDGGFGGVAWNNGVRSRLYFDWVRDGKGSVISETREFSRKKGNYTVAQQRGKGLHLDWDDWKFRKGEAPAQPETPKQKAVREKRDAAGVTQDILFAELKEFMEGFPARKFSVKDLSIDFAAHLASKGHDVAWTYLRDIGLPQIRAANFPYYSPGRGWVYVTGG